MTKSSAFCPEDSKQRAGLSSRAPLPLGKRMKTTMRHGCAVLLAVFALSLSSVNVRVLAGSERAVSKGETPVKEMTISEILRERTGELMSVRGVVGVGQSLCDGRPCVKVYVVKKNPEVMEEIRRILDPYLFSIEESGRFQSR
jgi:hypothetical protein